MNTTNEFLTKLAENDRKNGMTRKDKLGRAAAGVLLVAGAGAAVEVAHVAFGDSQPDSHVSQLRDEFKQAKADPAGASEGKYVWYAVDGGNPTTIAQAIAKPGETQEVTDELSANEVHATVNGVEQDILPQGEVLLEKSELNLTDPLVLKATSEFGPTASKQ
jgi:hypothetical protein